MPYTLPIGSALPSFHLLGTDGAFYSPKNFEKSRVLVVFFTCNHCPYVLGSDEITRKTAEKFKNQGVQFVGINSNSPHTYPEDSYEEMVKRMQKHHFPWLYLYDQTQESAQKFGALKTPHFFVFDEKRQLIYTGRGVDHPRDSSKVTVNDLENALNDYFKGFPVTTPLTNPIGCNIKWEGKEKHWMPPEACDLV